MNVAGVVRSGVALATVFCMLALSFQVPPPVRAEEEDYTQLEPKGMEVFRSALTWARTGKNTAVVFAVDRAEGDYSFNRLISFRMTSTGATKQAKTFMAGIKGRFVFADAISLAAVGAEAPASKTGLLFLAYYMNDKPNKLIFAAAPFDAKGKRKAAFEVLKTIEVDSSKRFANTAIFAQAAGDTVGVSLSTVVQPSLSSIVDDAQAYFLETDLNGALVRGPKAVKLPGGGKLMKFMSMRPAWKYNRWFVPCHRIDFEQLASPTAVDTEPVGSALMVYTARPKANGFAIKLKEIESDDQADATGAYEGIQFLPEVEGGSIPPPSSGLRLFYQKKTFIEDAATAAEQIPLEYTGSYYTRIVKKTAKARKAKRLAVPEWVPELQSEPGDRGVNSHEVVSEAVVTADGRIVIGMTRYQEIFRAASAPSDEGMSEIAGLNMVLTITLVAMVYITATAIHPELSTQLCFFNKMLLLGGMAAFLLPGYLMSSYVLAMMAVFLQL